jgi:predicted transcriptional regulator of viral defense system
VVAKAYAPCYVAGWSACDHWSLTEQLFRDLVIVTARPVRNRRLEVQGTPLLVKQFPLAMHFGTKTVWRDKTKVKVSDPSRTLIDVLDDPSLGGGIRHVAKIVAAYFDSEHRNDSLLVDYGRRFGNRTVFKRLGFLIEAVEISAFELIEECRSGMSKGLSLLDPSISREGRILKRWNLRVNVRFSETDRES